MSDRFPQLIPAEQSQTCAIYLPVLPWGEFLIAAVLVLLLI